MSWRASTKNRYGLKENCSKHKKPWIILSDPSTACGNAKYDVIETCFYPNFLTVRKQSSSEIDISAKDSNIGKRFIGLERRNNALMTHSIGLLTFACNHALRRYFTNRCKSKYFCNTSSSQRPAQKLFARKGVASFRVVLCFSFGDILGKRLGDRFGPQRGVG